MEKYPSMVIWGHQPNRKIIFLLFLSHFATNFIFGDKAPFNFILQLTEWIAYSKVQDKYGSLSVYTPAERFFPNRFTFIHQSPFYIPLAPSNIPLFSSLLFSRKLEIESLISGALSMKHICAGIACMHTIQLPYIHLCFCSNMQLAF